MAKPCNTEKTQYNLKPYLDDQDCNTAVALILKPTTRDHDILFVKRTENINDPWSGQIAFPGGKRDRYDANLRETAVRETLEEIGINLTHDGVIQGVLAPQNSTPKPELKILPFVFLLKKHSKIKLNEMELASFMWISTRMIIQNRTRVRFSFGEFPAYVVGEATIWGLTYRTLEDFFQTSKPLIE